MRYPQELMFFSFYTILEKKHEREVESLILRVAGPHLTLNLRKVRPGVACGEVRDFEPGTGFFERRKASRRSKSAGS